MNTLPLYDALVSIQVPAEKARAVVDALERDMSTTLATKPDLALLRQELQQDMKLLRQDMEMLRQELRQDMELLRQELRRDMELLRQELRQDMELLRQEWRHEIQRLEQKIELLRASMTVRLGSMLFVGLGLLFAALKLT